MRSRRTPGKRAVSRNDQVDRVLRILRDLYELDSVTLAELAARHGKHPRTIRRDLDALAQAGYPVVTEKTDAGETRWRIDGPAQNQRLASALDASHYLALRLAMAQGTALGPQSALSAQLETLARRLEAAVGKKGLERLRRVDGAILPTDRRSWRSAPSECLQPIIDAIVEQRVCRFVYRGLGRGDPTEWRALPLRVFPWDGTLYLHAANPDTGRVYTLNLSRVVSATLLAEHSVPPADYDREQLDAEFGVVSGGPLTRYRLVFRREVAGYIRERLWHRSRRTIELPGGALELTFETGASYEVDSWVASWRDWVEVLEPAALRESLCQVGAWYQERYGAPKSRAPRVVA